MSDHRDQHPHSLPSIAGYSQTIRENLARIDAVLPLIPLPVSVRQSAELESKPAGNPDPVAAKPPAPKGLLAPGGRIPTSKPRSTRRR